MIDITRLKSNYLLSIEVPAMPKMSSYVRLKLTSKAVLKEGNLSVG